MEIKKTTDNRLLIPRNDISIVKSRTVEVQLLNAAAGAQNKFILDEVLNPKATGSVIFTGMEVWTFNEQTNANSGRAIVNADSNKLALTMMWGNEEVIYQSPYESFYTANNYGMIRRLKALKFSLTSCYIQNMAALVSANQSALVTFYYRNK